MGYATQLCESNYSYLVPEIKPVNAKETTVRSEVSKQVVVEKGEILIDGLTQNEVKAVVAAIGAWDQYREKHGSVRLSGFLVDRLAKALPSLDHLQRKEIFERLEGIEIL